MSAQIFTLVEALSAPEMFVVSAARVFRAIYEGTAPPCLCLCNMFRRAGMSASIEGFVFFQRALISDPARSFVAEQLRSRLVGAGELKLLHAIAVWQHYPRRQPERSLELIASMHTRRLAAASGRAFALDMLDARLVLPLRPRRAVSYFHELQTTH
jgi:hypothetical protein